MTSRDSQHSPNPTRASQHSESQQKQQLLQGTGAQFEGASVDHAEMSQAVEELRSDCPVASHQLRAVLGRTDVTNSSRKELLSSDAVSGLSTQHRT